MNKMPLVLLMVWFLASPVVFSEEPDFKRVDGSHVLQFPRDHGAHPDYNTEWWYFVGHLKGTNNKTYGFELTFFRVGIDPQAQSLSKWRHHSLYLTHFALTDDHNQTFYHDERSSRGAFDQAGANESRLEVWNKDWRVELADEQFTMQAQSQDFGMDLKLKSAKPLVLHGKEGFSQKGPNLGQASYYSSFTRLKGSGSIRIGEKEIILKEAQAWMDHEVTSAGLAENIAGWDWFAIQLNNGQELMIYQLRTKDNQKDPFSKGSYVQKDGNVIPLKHKDYTIEPIDTWKSPKSGIVYPSGWNIHVKKTGHQFQIIPTVKEQELLTERTTGVNYWEGRCLVDGTWQEQAVAGAAYVELTGYDRALRYRS